MKFSHYFCNKCKFKVEYPYVLWIDVNGFGKAYCMVCKSELEKVFMKKEFEDNFEVLVFDQQVS